MRVPDKHLRTFSDQIKMIENRLNSCDYNCCIIKNDIGVLKSDMMYIKSQYVTLENVLNEQKALNLKMDAKLDAILNAFNPNDVNIEMNKEDALCEFLPDKKKMRIEGSIKQPYIMQWKSLVEKFDKSPLSQFIFLWYDFSVVESYNNIIGTKTDAQKNKKTRLKKVVTKLSEYMGPDVVVSQKPIGKGYDVWKRETIIISRAAAAKCFEVLKSQKRKGMEKYKVIDDMSITAFIRIIGIKKQYK